MNGENDGEGKIAKTAKAISELADKIPIYQDAVQPVAKELGKGLQTVARAVNAALLPVEGFVWGVEQIRDFIRARVGTKLENVPPAEIQAPKPHIAVPAIDALRYVGSENALSELYANLLATSMDKVTAYHAHPAFVDMIKGMCPDEARIMSYLAAVTEYPLINIRLINVSDLGFIVPHRYVSLLGVDAMCEHRLLVPTYIDNLERLGLIKVERHFRLHESAYKRIEEHPQIKSIIEDLRKTEERKVDIEMFRLAVTDLGKQFIRACVLDKNSQARN